MTQSVAQNESQAVQLEKRRDSSNVTFKIRKLVTTPTLHQDCGEVQTERRERWSELFSDLFYVIAAINLTHRVIHDPTPHGVGIFILYATLFWTTWSNWTVMTIRFRLEGLFYDILFLAHMIGVIGMALRARTFDDKAGFAVCYIVTRITVSLVYVVIFAFVKRGRPLGGSSVLIGLTNSILALITCFFNDNVFIILMSVAIGIDMVGPFVVRVLSSSRHARVPLHVEQTADRFGLIMMVYLGETLNSIGQQELSEDDRAVQYTMLALSCVVVFGLHLMYYHVHTGHHQHALRISVLRGLSWSFLHWILGICFLLFGAGLFLVLEEFHQGYVHESSAWIACVPYSFSLHLMLLIRATHILGRTNVLHEMGLSFYSYFWWTVLVLWPFATYFIPFAYENLTSLDFIAILAGHSLGINIVETAVTHTISSHPKFIAAMAAADEVEVASQHTKAPHVPDMGSRASSKHSVQVKISSSGSTNVDQGTQTDADVANHVGKCACGT